MNQTPAMPLYAVVECSTQDDGTSVYWVLGSGYTFAQAVAALIKCEEAQRESGGIDPIYIVKYQ